MRTNAIYCGDCLKVLGNKVDFPDDSVDLIYLDPPFFTNKQYEVIWKDGYEVRAFEDRWQGGIEHYIAWMEPRLRECWRVLKKTGSFYMHIDQRANAHVRILLDKLFSPNRFQNEIIWHYGLGGSSPRRFAAKHDNIYFYTKSDNWFFEPPMKPATSQRMRGQLKKWDDVWDIATINNMATERLGYPTQKPEALLEPIIQASSRPGELILDAFCGCGTATAVAHRLGRRWLGIDVSPTAVKLIAERMRKLGAVGIEIVGLPKTIDELKALPPFEFQNAVIQILQGRVGPRKVGDLGIDGYTFDGSPIQIKQSENVTRPVIDAFESAVKRDGKTRGMVVAFSFTRGAFEEVARARNKDGLEIELKTVEELLKGG